jgi:hypothetical protein
VNWETVTKIKTLCFERYSKSHLAPQELAAKLLVDHGFLRCDIEQAAVVGRGPLDTVIRRLARGLPVTGCGRPPILRSNEHKQLIDTLIADMQRGIFHHISELREMVSTSTIQIYSLFVNSRLNH